MAGRAHRSPSELRYLESLQGSGIRPGLERMRAFLRAADQPQRSVPSILVGGTNGKGSTAATLFSILRASGYRCGLYTSPHLVELRERWNIDGQMVPLTKLRAAIRQLRDLSRVIGTQPTYFEALTILAFLLFQECELAVLEVGMGGRLDATNVVRPILSLISPVSFDHMEFLGNTLRRIAREKAGIIHSGSIALTSSRSPVVLEVIERRCARLKVPLHIVSEQVRATQISTGVDGTRLRMRTPLRSYELQSPLAGLHQVDNVALAVRAAEELQDQFPNISRSSIERGVAQTRWRGRLERFRVGRKTVWVDGGHNLDAAERIAAFVDEFMPASRVLVFGIMRDKEVEAVARVLFPRFDRVILTRPPSDRAAAPKDLAKLALALGRDRQVEVKPSRAIEKALASDATAVLICGSLYLAGAAVRHLDSRSS